VPRITASPLEREKKHRGRGKKYIIIGWEGRGKGLSKGTRGTSVPLLGFAGLSGLKKGKGIRQGKGQRVPTGEGGFDAGSAVRFLSFKDRQKKGVPRPWTVQFKKECRRDAGH